jgi:WD40 repeat protein
MFEHVVFTPGGDILYWPIETGEIVALDARTGDKVGSWMAHEGPATTIDISYNRALLVTGGIDGLIRLWKAPFDPIPERQQQRTVTEDFLSRYRIIAPHAPYDDFDYIDVG